MLRSIIEMDAGLPTIDGAGPSPGYQHNALFRAERCVDNGWRLSVGIDQTGFGKVGPFIGRMFFRADQRQCAVITEGAKRLGCASTSLAASHDNDGSNGLIHDAVTQKQIDRI